MLYPREKFQTFLLMVQGPPNPSTKYSPSVPSSCWRYGSEDGSYLHIWWDCSSIHSLWSQVFSIYSSLYDQPLQPSPEIALLSMLPGSITSQKRSLLRFFLSAARQIIPLFWKTTTRPPLALWVSAVNDIMRMEEMIAMDNDTFDKFKTLWLIWIEYSTSNSLKTLLTTHPCYSMQALSHRGLP